MKLIGKEAQKKQLNNLITKGKPIGFFLMKTHQLTTDMTLSMKCIEAICSKNKGLTTDEIAKITKLSGGGSLSKILIDLELSNFIKKIHPY